MSLLAAALTGHFAAVTPLKPPSSGVTQTYLERVQAFSTLFWRLNEASGGTFNEGVSGTLDFVADAAAQAALEYANTTLAQHDSGGRCLGLSTHGSSGVTVLTLAYDASLHSTAGAWTCIVQVDDLSDKHVLIACDDDTHATGTFSCEILPTGAARFWRRDGNPTLPEVVTATGLITVGQAYHLAFTWGSEGLRIFIDDVLRGAQGSPTTSWPTTTTASLYVGRWYTDVSGLDGLIGWLAFRNTQPTAEQIAPLAAVQSVSLLTGADLGTVEDGGQLAFSVRDYGHFTATGVTANEVSNEGTIDVSVSGETVTVTGVTEDLSADLSITVTDGRGTTPSAAFTIQVTAASGEFITTPEVQASWNGDYTDHTFVTAAISEAISAASAGAASSSSGRGVVQLTPSETYFVNCSDGSANVSQGAVKFTAALSNVEIRTAGQPTGSTRAVLTFRSWLSQSGMDNRAIVLFDNCDNCWLTHVRLDGNKTSFASTSANYTSGLLAGRINATAGNNGGINNIGFHASTNCRVEWVESYDALTDGLWIDRVDGTSTRTTSLLVQDCDFHNNRRQGMSIITAGVSGTGYDQLVFRRCKFRLTGEETRAGLFMHGQKPGFGVDIEPNNPGDALFGITFDDCDFEDNQGGEFNWNAVDGYHLSSQSDGRAFCLDMKDFTATHLKILDSRFNRNRNQGIFIFLRNGGDVDNMVISDNVYGTGVDANGVQEIRFEQPGVLTDLTMARNDVPTIRFHTTLAASGHDIDITTGGFPVTVIRNGITNVTVDGVLNP